MIEAETKSVQSHTYDSLINQDTLSYVFSREVPKSIQQAIVEVPDYKELTNLQKEQLIFFALWLHGGNFNRFISRVSNNFRAKIENTILTVLDEHILDPYIGDLQGKIENFEKSSRNKTKRNHKKTWQQRQDQILRGEIVPQNKSNKQKANDFQKIAGMVERLDSFGVDNPQQVAALLKKRKGYIRYVRHRLIRAGKIDPIKRSHNFDLKHAEEQMKIREIEHLISIGLDTNSIAEKVKYHPATIRRHRRRLDNQGLVKNSAA